MSQDKLPSQRTFPCSGCEDVDLDDFDDERHHTCEGCEETFCDHCRQTKGGEACKANPNEYDDVDEGWFCNECFESIEKENKECIEGYRGKKAQKQKQKEEEARKREEENKKKKQFYIQQYYNKKKNNEEQDEKDQQQQETRYDPYQNRKKQ